MLDSWDSAVVLVTRQSRASVASNHAGFNAGRRNGWARDAGLSRATLYPLPTKALGESAMRRLPAYSAN